MGMYDREPNWEEHFQEGDRMVIMDMRYVGTIRTRFGDAHRTLITVMTRDSYPKRTTYSAIGAGFMNLATRAERTDFPHVAEYVRVSLGEGREVKRFAKVDVSPRAFIDGNDGPPVDTGDLMPANADAGSSSENDIPF